MLLQTEKIPFRIRLRKCSYTGTVEGNLRSQDSFEVFLSNGNYFSMIAVYDKELSRYTWITKDEKWHVLALALGKIVERHFAKQAVLV